MSYEPVQYPLEHGALVACGQQGADLLGEFGQCVRRGSEPRRQGYGRQQLLVHLGGGPRVRDTEELLGPGTQAGAQPGRGVGDLAPHADRVGVAVPGVGVDVGVGVEATGVEVAEVPLHQPQRPFLYIRVLVAEGLGDRGQQLGRRGRILLEHLAQQDELGPDELLLGPEEHRAGQLGESSRPQLAVQGEAREDGLGVCGHRGGSVGAQGRPVRDPLALLVPGEVERGQQAQEDLVVRRGAAAPQQPGQAPVDHDLAVQETCPGQPGQGVRPVVRAVAVPPVAAGADLLDLEQRGDELPEMRVLPQIPDDRAPTRARPVDVVHPAAHIGLGRGHRAAREPDEAGHQLVRDVGGERALGQPVHEVGEPGGIAVAEHVDQDRRRCLPPAQIGSGEPGRHGGGTRLARGAGRVQRGIRPLSRELPVLRPQLLAQLPQLRHARAPFGIRHTVHQRDQATQVPRPHRPDQ
ncbi:hypothetical protein [Streptomyces europaeiscabiei]